MTETTQRRNFLYIGAAAAAGLTGAGVAWFKSANDTRPITSGQTSGSSDAGVNAEFWQQTYDTPGGAPLPMSRFAGQVLLVNFWATWCPPCIEELPLLDKFYTQQKSRGWNVLGLAVDQPSAVRAWLQKAPLAFPVAMAGLSGTQLSKSLGNQNGGLPFSVVFDRSGKVAHRKTGQLSVKDLDEWSRNT